MAEMTNVPEIRFEGFTDPWEQRKLGELCTISKGHGYSKADIRDAGTPLILYGRLYTQYESRIENVDTFAVEQEGSLLSKGNEVIVPASGETAEDIAVASSVRRSGIIFGGDLNVVTPVSKLDPDYIALAITYSKAHDDLAKRAQGKSVVHVHGNDIAEVEIPYPSESEQKRISTVVLGLDSLITLHQRKYEKLCTVKKSMLDKMFPKPGETEPEVRFEGFTDPWEQRKFSDLTDRVSIQSSDPDLPQVEYEDIISGMGMLNKDLRDKEGGKTGIKFYAGDVLYGKLRPYLMNWLYPQFNGVAVGDFWVLRATECDTSFLYRLVQTDSFQRLANVSSGSKMPRADWNLISQSFFAVPADHAEQKAIAKSLTELDDLITLHQRKLELLRNIKKSLLDRMFV